MSHTIGPLDYNLSERTKSSTRPSCFDESSYTGYDDMLRGTLIVLPFIDHTDHSAVDFVEAMSGLSLARISRLVEGVASGEFASGRSPQFVTIEQQLQGLPSPVPNA